jgi:3D (Asp-Asp-Asp) domain-containing protein
MLLSRFRVNAARVLIWSSVLVAIGGPADALGSDTPSGGSWLPATSTGAPTGGASPAGGAPTTGGAPPSVGQPATPPPGSKTAGRWLSGFTISEYWPAPESWFTGRLVSAPGLPGKHRIDWLYSGEGISMNGEGVGLDGRMYHVAALGSDGWVTAAGKLTNPAKGWSGGPPYWRAGNFWRNQWEGVTFPLQAGGWSAGVGRGYVSLAGASFAPGPSLRLRPYQSIAVDPRVIPFGSLVYLPAYRGDGHAGWFVAQDTGGAILGHRIDVFRTPPATAGTGGQYLVGQHVFVVKPGS